MIGSENVFGVFGITKLWFQPIKTLRFIRRRWQPVIHMKFNRMTRLLSATRNKVCSLPVHHAIKTCTLRRTHGTLVANKVSAPCGKPFLTVQLVKTRSCRTKVDTTAHLRCHAATWARLGPGRDESDVILCISDTSQRYACRRMVPHGQRPYSERLLPDHHTFPFCSLHVRQKQLGLINWNNSAVTVLDKQ